MVDYSLAKKRVLHSEAIKAVVGQIYDLGIVYAHRNEDIVNMGLEYERKHGSSFRNERIISKLSCQEDSIEKSCAREQKKNEFIKIAQYRCMELVDFSNWILSASSAELKQLRWEYKNKGRKRKTKN
ncbi:hypothetical protein HPP92_010226 [Vanilla planifolia]|uniref:Uncharacterized protein n=1 Tax=Vanilla planifolia TaxID=51239 RepID=A0A835QWS1_VANPL|nr:hypothetical protein HPP92_010226 [Vanilla planifolia]